MAAVTRISLQTHGAQAQLRPHATRLFCLVLALCLCAVPSFPAAAAEAVPEYTLKAAYLLDFTKFIEWPAASLGDANASFNICVYGGNPFGNALDEIVRGEVAYARKVAVQPLAEPAPMASVQTTLASSCRILFVSGPDEDMKNIPGLGPGVLTVGEGERFVRNGGMIGFILENRRVTFAINRTAAEGAGLKFSSGLLRVAKAIVK